MFPFNAWGLRQLIYFCCDDFEHAMSSLMYINVYWLDTKQENIYKAFIETQAMKTRQL